MKNLFLSLFILTTSLLFAQDSTNHEQVIKYHYSIKGKDTCNCEFIIVIDNPVNPDIVSLINYKDTIRLIVFIDTNYINNDMEYGFVRLNVIGDDKIESIELLSYSAIIVYKKKKINFGKNKIIVITEKNPSVKLYYIHSTKKIVKKFDWEYWEEHYKGDRCYSIK